MLIGISPAACTSPQKRPGAPQQNSAPHHANESAPTATPAVEATAPTADAPRSAAPSTREAKPAVTGDLTPYAPASAGEYTYRRTGAREPAGGAAYAIRFTPGQRAEGALSTTPPIDFDTYLERDRDKRRRPMFTWPRHKSKSHDEFFIAFDPPIVQLPRRIQVGEAQDFRSRLRTYTYKGEKSVRGSVERTIRRLPDEPTEAGGKTYNNCVHLELSTQYDIHLLGDVEAREEIWLAEGIGEVRRTQEWQGRMLLKSIHEAWVMELIEQREEGDRTAAASYQGASSQAALEAWSACAGYIQPSLPTPYLQGVVAQLAE